MDQLIRTKSGPFTLEDSVTLIDAHDNYKEWKKSGDSYRISSILRPLESMLIDLPLIVVKDSAVDALCHGADLGFPGVVSVSKKMRRGQLVSIGTNRGEAIALGRATVDAEEIAKNPKSKGKVARLERVIMERGTYPREWKSK
jgi:H/ACA ribonucleoprotein complex subunit 4